MKRWVRNVVLAILLIFPVLLITITYLEDVSETGGAVGTFSLIAKLPRVVIDLALAAGYVGIFALMLLEAAALPIPSEIILPLAGYLVSQGKMEFWLVVLYSTVAALIGSFVDYALGWKLGDSFLVGRSRLPYVDVVILRKAEAWFEKYGPTAVAFFRLVPGARVLISFPAGVYRMSRLKFAAYTLAGCLPWNITLIYLGWWLGSSWETVVADFRYINLAAYGSIVLLLIWIGWRVVSKKAEHPQQGTESNSA